MRKSHAAANTEIVGVQARARGALVENHQLLSLLETPQVRGERANVRRLRGDIEQMGKKPTDLAKEHADELRSLWKLEPQQPLRRETEGVFLIHRSDVIQPIEIGQRLHVRLVLDELLGAAMQKPDMGIDASNDFSVKLEQEPEHAVSRRMHRSEIYREVACGIEFSWRPRDHIN